LSRKKNLIKQETPKLKHSKEAKELFARMTKYELKSFSNDQVALMLQSLIKIDHQTDNQASLEVLSDLPVIKQAQGNLKFIINQLLEGKIKVQDNILHVNPAYVEKLDVEDNYLYVTNDTLSISSYNEITRGDSVRTNEDQNTGKSSIVLSETSGDQSTRSEKQKTEGNMEKEWEKKTVNKKSSLGSNSSSDEEESGKEKTIKQDTQKDEIKMKECEIKELKPCWRKPSLR